MPRSFVKGSQICNYSIRDIDLADFAVITRTIKDENVTEPKLSPDVRERLLSRPDPIHRIVVTETLPAHTNFTLPGNVDYQDLNTFMTRLKVYKNGQLLDPGIDANDPVADIYPGSTTTEIKFFDPLRCQDHITVEIL